MRKFLGAVSLAALATFGTAAPASAEQPAKQPAVQQVKQAQNEDGGGSKAGLWGLLGLLGLLGAMGMRKSKPKVGIAESRTGTGRHEGPEM